MVFSSLTFLYAYLPIVLAVYFLVPLRFRNLVLLIVSLFFYGWGEPVYVLVMIASIIINWLFGKAIAATRDTERGKSGRILAACMVFNLLLLGFFKYFDFLAENLIALGIHVIRPLHLGLPIGISFYTFQTMSYPIDLYRKETDPQESLVSFGAYVCMFPQLIAGPIVRYTDIAKQLNQRTITSKKFYQGISRFMVGLCKKVLLANSAGQVYEGIAALTASQQSVVTAWLGAICYTFQIYFDFSGYSDMAIGLGKMLGFDFLENFNYPYISKTVTEFWRRWHMSLSFWFRDYVYIPLGGNRHGLKRQIINIMIVWLLTGFWHGASWNFVLWGVFYGVLLIFEKYVLGDLLPRIPTPVRGLVTMLLVMCGWVLFSAPDLTGALLYLKAMFGGAAGWTDGNGAYLLSTNLTVLLVGAFCATPVYRRILDRFDQKWVSRAKVVAYPLLFALCVVFMVSETYNPFLYFRF